MHCIFIHCGIRTRSRDKGRSISLAAADFTLQLSDTAILLKINMYNTFLVVSRNNVHCVFDLFRAYERKTLGSQNAPAEKYKKERRIGAVQKDTLTSARSSSKRSIYFHGITRISQFLLSRLCVSLVLPFLGSRRSRAN